MAARASQTKQDKQDNELILYRLDRVESAVREVGSKVDKQEIIKRSDLVEFRESIITRITDMRTDLQRQLDDKADKTSVTDIRRLMFSAIGLLGSIIAGMVIYYLTGRGK
jgi:hypothetical protein